MLVLCRKVGQRIRIGEEIILEVTEIGRGMVRIGIRAPKSLKVLREELLAEREPRTARSERGR